MRDVAIVGGGLAGLASAAALSSAGYQVTIHEAKPFLGGRATSYTAGDDVIDNCQHILLRCCVNLLDFYRRLDVSDRIQFHRKFYFIEPGGEVSTMERGALPTPLHFTGSFAHLRFLNAADKLAVARALLTVRNEYHDRSDLDRITMLDWLREKRQTERAIERFWRQILVSAINEELDRMAALHGLQVFWLGFLARNDAYEMGIPSVPLGELYSSEVWSVMPNVKLRLRSTVESLDSLGADYCIVAVPFEKARSLVKEVSEEGFSHSPITGIHLWFDRPITDLPHATLLDRTLQWMFNKSGGRYLQLVVSASRSMVSMGRNEVIALAVKELEEFFPRVREAKLEKAHVVKEVRATYSASPGIEALRPVARTSKPNVFLAGDWTRTGWPATMEGAVRSGYLAAEAVTAAAGNAQRFLLPDIG